jgi:hypothetical protein
VLAQVRRLWKLALGSLTHSCIHPRRGRRGARPWPVSEFHMPTGLPGGVLRGCLWLGTGLVMRINRDSRR